MVTNSQAVFPLFPYVSLFISPYLWWISFPLIFRVALWSPSLVFTSFPLFGQTWFYFLFMTPYSCQSRSSRSSEVKGSRQGNSTEAALSLKILAFHSEGVGEALYILWFLASSEMHLEKEFKIWSYFFMGRLALHHLYALWFVSSVFIILKVGKKFIQINFLANSIQAHLHFHLRTWGMCCTNAYLWTEIFFKINSSFYSLLVSSKLVNEKWEKKLA